MKTLRSSRAWSVFVLCPLLLGAAGAQSFRFSRIVVVTPSEISVEEKGKLQKEEIDKLPTRLEAKGFVKVERAGNLFFFSPDVWAQKQFDALGRTYAGVAESVDKEGFLSASQSASAKEVLQNTFGSLMGFGNADQAKYSSGHHILRVAE